MRTPNTGDRTYLVLAKPNLIMKASDSEGWRLQDARLLDGRARTTTPRLLRIFGVPPERGR
jgi:hypothetical protein